MRDFLEKHRLLTYVILTVLFALWWVPNWGGLSTLQHVVCLFSVAACLHELEEIRFPGGFMKLMASKFGFEVDTELIHLPVYAFLIVIIAMPMLAPGVAWLALVPLYLCAFEAFVHVAGIFLHHLKRPYTPGMATAVLLELPLAIWGFHYIATQGLASAGLWVLGFVVMVALFLLMQVSMFRIIGTSHLQVMRAMMAKRKAAK